MMSKHKANKIQTENRKVFLNKENHYSWCIKNHNGNVLWCFPASSIEEAESKARSWASSWNNIEVVLVAD